MKTTKEKIAVMQAFADGKQIQRSKDGIRWVDDEEPIWDWSMFYYRVKTERHLPTTWEDFCKINPIKRREAYINMSSNISTYDENNEYKRDADADKNILPNRRYAEAMLALCQLIQLRDCYNEGWQPDWKSDFLKHTIHYSEDKLQALSAYKSKQILTFETEELRDEFLKNFKDLIEIAKPLL